MSAYSDFLQFQQQNANIAKTQADTADIGTQSAYRLAQTDKLRSDMSRAEALRQAVMAAGQGAPTDNDTAPVANAAAQATGSDTPTQGQTIGQPTGPSAQIAAIQRNISDARLQLKREGALYHAAQSVGDIEAMNKANDNQKDWQEKINSQTNELAKARADVAVKLASAAGAVMDSGVNLPQVLEHMDELQPGTVAKLPIDRDPATGRPVWSPKTAQVLKTMQDEGLKAKEQYDVQNDLAQRGQQQQRIDEEIKRDAQTKANNEAQRAIDRDRLDLEERKFNYKKDTDERGTPAENRRVVAEAVNIGNTLQRVPSVKWMNTMGPKINTVVDYANGVMDGKEKQSTTGDQDLADAYVSTVLGAAPRTAQAYRLLKENMNVPESWKQAIQATYKGRQLPASVVRDMSNEIKKRYNDQKADAIDNASRTRDQLNSLGVDPKPYIPTWAQDKAALPPKEQATVSALVGG